MLVVSVYGRFSCSVCDTISGPTRFSDTAKEMKSSVKEFINTNVTFIGELPSCLAVNKESKSTSSTERYTEHTEINNTGEYAQLSLLQDLLIHVKKLLQTTSNLLQTVASEFLVVMLNDLDRIITWRSVTHILIPVAYALKGTSMPTDVLRKMNTEVIAKCKNGGLHVLVTARDGQWHVYEMRDNEGHALTVHQLQKYLWKDVNSRTKPEL